MSQLLTPLGDRVVATREEASNRTASGLYLPDSAKEKAIVAVVDAVGPDVKEVKKGDRVVYKQYTTTEVKVNGKESIILKEEDILAKIS